MSVSYRECCVLKSHAKQQEALDNHSELKFVVCRLLFRVRFSSIHVHAHSSGCFSSFSSYRRCVFVLCLFCMHRFLFTFVELSFRINLQS